MLRDDDDDDCDDVDGDSDDVDSQPMVDLAASVPGVVQGGPGGMLRDDDNDDDDDDDTDRRSAHGGPGGIDARLGADGPGDKLGDDDDEDDDDDDDVDRWPAHGGPGGVNAGRGAGGAGRHAEGSGAERGRGSRHRLHSAVCAAAAGSDSPLVCSVGVTVAGVACYSSVSMPAFNIGCACVHIHRHT